MNRSRTLSVARAIALGLTATAVLAGGLLTPASAAEVEIVREYREVPGAGVFTTCDDGSVVTFTSLSYRDYTTWLRDGVAVREHRHLTFDGTLTRGSSHAGLHRRLEPGPGLRHRRIAELRRTQASPCRGRAAAGC